ncbi:FtsX-like permease family protein [Sphingomicrobium sp. XHP0239]|uniref:ABC transporter permease n=1 Tax=Sphingomicrobium maritimum TaxID=3133972 RepID=UPI0031CC48A9
MSLGARLAKRDLKGGFGGLGLLFTCLLLSIAGLAAVLSLVAAMESAIDDSGRSLLGGDLKFEQAQRPATEAELAVLRDAGEISVGVATRAMLLTEDDFALIDLRSGDDAYPLAGEIVFAQGVRPSNAEQIALGAEIASRSGLAVGDTVDLGQASFTVSGLIDRMPGGSFVLAPPALLTDEGMARTQLVVPGSLVDYEVRVLVEGDRDLNALGEELASQLEPIGWDVDTREGAAGGTQRFVSSTGDMLLFVAIAALGIGALGIGSAMRAFAASRRETIARLKLVGATTAPLRSMLGIEILLVATLAIVPALAIGALAPLIVGEIVADRLPLAPDPGPHWGALGLAAAVGILTTLAVSWRPLASALRTQPKATLRQTAAPGDMDARRSDWIVPLVATAGVVGLLLLAADTPFLAAVAIGSLLGLAILFLLFGWLVRRLARSARHIGSPVVRLGIAALDRPGNATQRLVLALGLGLSILVALGAGGQSLLTEIDTAIPDRAPSHFIIDVPRDREADLRALAEREAPGAEVRVVPSLRAAVTAVDGVAVADLPEDQQSWLVRGDRGLTFSAEVPEGNRVTAGEWWPTDYDGPPLISLENEAADDLGITVGDTLTFSIAGREITATIASLREVDWQTFGFNFGIVFAPGTLEDAPYTLLAQLEPGATGLADGFERRLATELPMVTAISVAGILAEVRSILTALDAAIRIAVALAIAIGVIVLAGSVVATRAARARDLTLLRLVGARWRQLVASQLTEFALLSVTAVALAFATGLALAYAAIVYQFEIAFRPDMVQLGLLAAASIALAIGSAMIAVWPALTASTGRALKAR